MMTSEITALESQIGELTTKLKQLRAQENDID
jgi:hypothetical protein